jgi:hypothetical protein
MTARRAVNLSALGAALILAACSNPPPTRTGSPTSGPTPAAPGAGPRSSPAAAAVPGRSYPEHTRIVATTFWVGEIFDPTAPDGSQVTSSYDPRWLADYGGCDGVVVAGVCGTQPRTTGNGFFPTRMTPRQNPFYLDLPFDDLNDPAAFAHRAAVVPWSGDPGYAGRGDDPTFSYLKNRWVRITRADRTCYGQVEDAGPGQYDDEAYVFGHDDRRPADRRYNGAGMDVSPALNGCLGFVELNGDTDLVDWQFVDDPQLPPGPWLRLVTTQGALP